MHAAAETTTAIERQIFIDAKPETVWELLVDPKQITRWMGLTTILEPHRGGQYRSEVVPGRVARGEVIEIDPPRRLVYTFGWELPNTPVPPGSSTVVFELQPSDGGTLLRFAHRDLPTAESAASHSQGWDHYFERLAQVGRGGEPGIDAWVTREVIRGYFAALEKRDGWQSFLADDLLFTSFTSPVKEVHGKDAYLEATKRFYAGVASLAVRDLMVDGEKAIALTRYELQRPGVEPFRSDVAEVFTVRGGRIASFGIYFDTAPFPK